MKWKRWAGFAFVLGTLVAVVIAAEKFRIGSGFLRGDAFYRGYPTSYWREILRTDGQAGNVKHETVEALRATSALQVLRECINDPDRNVRWPAVAILGRLFGSGPGVSSQILPDLCKLLSDGDTEVRFQAVLAVTRMRADASPAADDLMRLCRDPDPLLSDAADRALWEIDPARAIKAGGWKPFASERWGFSAVFPGGLPKEEQKPLLILGNEIVVHTFMAPHGVTQCVIAVSEYPNEVAEAEDVIERFKAASGPMAALFTGNVVRDVEIDQHNLKGHEFEINADKSAVIRSRIFWVKPRLYQVNVVINRKYDTPNAAKFFLDSFKLEPAASGSIDPSDAD